MVQTLAHKWCFLLSKLPCGLGLPDPVSQMRKVDNRGLNDLPGLTPRPWAPNPVPPALPRGVPALLESTLSPLWPSEALPAQARGLSRLTLPLRSLIPPLGLWTCCSLCLEGSSLSSVPPLRETLLAHPNQDTSFVSLMLFPRCLTYLCPFITCVFHEARGLAALLISMAQHLARSGCCEMGLCFAALGQVKRDGGWGQGCGRLGTPGIEGAACSQKLDLREVEAGRCCPPLFSPPDPPPCLTLISFLESVSFAFPKSR